MTKNTIKKTISALTLTLMLLVQVAPVWAQTAPAAPTAPDAPTAPENTTEAPSAPEAPAAPESPPPPTAPEAPSAPTLEEALADDKTSQEQQSTEQDSTWTRRQRDGDGGYTGSSSDGSETGTTGTTSTQSSGNQTGGQTGDSKVGDSTVSTGNATNGATLSTSANTNVKTADDCGTCGGGGGGATVKNTGNGDGSSNEGSIKTTNNDLTVQDNTAKVDNNLSQDTNTGKNSASKNTGGNSTITTGDANTTGTLITAVNTNIDGVAVAEFNVVDDHVGDIVLDFGANCISGCGPSGSATAVNSGNGSDSDNNASIDQTTNNATFQTNDATVENAMTLTSDSGNNQADRNTGGNSTITTGDANVSASSLTFANNNLGGVYYYVVNIFGDLVGDIIFPEEMLAYGICCSADLTAVNSGNGDGSTNTANVSLSDNDSTFQTNVANIQNNLVLDATTGDNSTSRNTTGSNSIETGNANIEAQVLNIANSNIEGGTWWLVLINEAGQWIGRLFGSDGGSYAGSAGTEFTMNAAGEITAINSGNGSGSTNTTSVSQENNSTTVQTNNANITNTLNLSANTGGNSASRNTGGDSSITTGDANIIANLVNFVNNNISGGKLFVSVVNVFGSWIGDFLPPGFTKPQAQANASSDSGVGGSENQQESAGGGSSSGSSSSGGNSGGSTTTASTGSITAAAASVTVNLSGALPTYLGTSTVDGQSTGLMSVAQGSAELDEVAAKKVINVNLAWLLVLLPAWLLISLARKRIVFVRPLPSDR